MCTITDMTDTELRTYYLYLCDRLIEAFQRLRTVTEKDFPTMQNSWYSEAAYRWRCLEVVQEEMERRHAVSKH